MHIQSSQPDKRLCYLNIQYQNLKHAQKIKFSITTHYRLMQVKSIAGCSKGSILQSFPPSLSYLCFLYLKQNIRCGYSMKRLNEAILFSNINTCLI